jgi:hypothetical protein
MRKFLQDKEHLVRMAGLFLAGVLVFLIVRALLVPGDFHQYGHFRTGALADSAARAATYAGREACASCHSDVLEARKGSRHDAIGCEACHGALSAHASDPGVKPERPEAQPLCLGCHRKDGARPKNFPQVIPEDHMGGEACGTCHKPHHPEMS